MRSKVISVLAALCLVAVGVAGALMTGDSEEYERYHQHREAQQLSGLSSADQAAASSMSTDPETFASHLPVVSIDTRGQEVPGERLSDDQAVETTDNQAMNSTFYEERYSIADDGERTIAVDFELFSSEGSANRLSGASTVQTQAEIRYRGHSSRWFDKKSYAVSFTEADRVTNRDLDVLGMGADDDWILNGPYLDKTLMRNYVTMNLVAQFMPYVPEVRFCELFVNGEYQGVYVLMETVKVSAERVGLNKSDQRDTVTSYLVRRDWDDIIDVANYEDFLDVTYNSGGVGLQIIYPTTTNITQKQRDWIESDVNRIEKQLYSYDHDTSGYGYWTTLDVDSFIDYAIVSEMTLNSDAGAYSTYLYKDVRGLLAIGPVWDFNNAYNNYAEYDMSELGFFTIERPLFFMLYKDEDYVERTISRYRYLRENYLSDEAFESYVDEVIDYLGPAIERNYAVWGYSFSPEGLLPSQKLIPDDRNPRSFEEAIVDLKEAFRERGEWMDEYIENLRQFSHESAVKPFNH